MALPQIESITNSGSNSATTSPAVAYPAYEDGDLLVSFLYIDDDDNITPPTTGPNSETLEVSIDGDSGSAAGPAIGVIAWIGTASRTAGTHTWSINVAEGWVGKTVLIKAGQFNEADAIESSSSIGGSSTASSNVPTPAWTAASAGGGLVLVGLAIDADPCTGAPTGWSIDSTTDIGSVSGTVGTRDTGTTSSESISSANFTCANDTSSSVGVEVSEAILDYQTTQWRIRDDDDNEANATWLAAEDVDWTPDTDTNFRIRFGCQEGRGLTPTDTFKLQYRVNGGTWIDATTTSSYIRITGSDEFVDGADCTQQITSGTFVSNNNGMVDTSGQTGSFTMTANAWIECEFCVQLRSADYSCPDEVDVRIVETGGAIVGTPSAGWPTFGGGFADIPTPFDTLASTAFQNSLVGGAGGGTKINGGIDLNDSAVQWTTNAPPPSTTDEGIRQEFNAGGTAVNMTNEIFIVSLAYNAPNRIQIRNTTNRGQVFTLMSSTVNYKDFIVGGNDTALAFAPNHKVLIIDPDATADATGGSGLTTSSVLFWQCTNREEAISGTSNNQSFMSKAIRCSTVNSGNIPRIYGPCCSWDTLKLAVYGTGWDTIEHLYVQPLGTALFLGCPVSIGKSGLQTKFNDNGATIVSPSSSENTDPRFHLASNAMRLYFGSMQTGDTAELSGTYDWGTRAPFDLDTTETITLNNATFRGMGTITIGAGVTGAATFDDTDVLADTADSWDLDGSTFQNPLGDACLEMG